MHELVIAHFVVILAGEVGNEVVHVLCSDVDGVYEAEDVQVRVLWWWDCWCVGGRQWVECVGGSGCCRLRWQRLRRTAGLAFFASSVGWEKSVCSVSRA